jgi:hypothetical protein
MRLTDTDRVVRWPSILSLALSLLLGPGAALMNQELTYLVDTWSCNRRVGGVIQLVPLACLVVATGAGLSAYGHWKQVGRGLEDERGDIVETRTRFVAMLGMASATLSSLVILAQWLAAAFFDPCMHA